MPGEADVSEPDVATDSSYMLTACDDAVTPDSREAMSPDSGDGGRVGDRDGGEGERPTGHILSAVVESHGQALTEPSLDLAPLG